jgi:hypothetical protein
MVLTEIIQQRKPQEQGNTKWKEAQLKFIADNASESF